VKLTTLANDIGKGLVAGAAGTAAMTVSSTLEAKLRGRQASTAPARAAAKALGIEVFEDGEAYAKFSNLVHWGYGTGWGVARGVMRALGISPRLATPAHFAALWGSAIVTLPKFDAAPPVTEWGKEEVAIDLFHHAVYVATAGVVYELLSSSRSAAELMQ
jgi:hypothetical protein